MSGLHEGDAIGGILHSSLAGQSTEGNCLLPQTWLRAGVLWETRSSFVAALRRSINVLKKIER